MLAEKVAKSADVLLQSPIGHEGAVARENFRLRQRNQRAALIHLPQNEFTRFYRRARARRRLYSAPFDLRFREPIPISEMLVRVIKRRNAVQVQG